MHVHDLHATILHLMGLDHERLTYRYSGRDFRLTDVAGRVRARDPGLIERIPAWFKGKRWRVIKLCGWRVGSQLRRRPSEPSRRRPRGHLRGVRRPPVGADPEPTMRSSPRPFPYGPGRGRCDQAFLRRLKRLESSFRGIYVRRPGRPKSSR